MSDWRLPVCLLVLSIGCLLVLSIPGCIGSPANPAATQPVTNIDPATTQPSFWYAKPATEVSSDDFDKLWDACEEAARNYLFAIDRTDERAGIITTVPLVSSQWFEFWRPDLQTWPDTRESSIATVRRTIRFEFTRLPDGTFQVAPKVLVEREAIQEIRITSVVDYKGVFTLPRKVHDQPKGSRESDIGSPIPHLYWYPIGRDTALESTLVSAIEKKLRQ